MMNQNETFSNKEKGFYSEKVTNPKNCQVSLLTAKEFKNSENLKKYSKCTVYSAQGENGQLEELIKSSRPLQRILQNFVEKPIPQGIAKRIIIRVLQYLIKKQNAPDKKFILEIDPKFIVLLQNGIIVDTKAHSTNLQKVEQNLEDYINSNELVPLKVAGEKTYNSYKVQCYQIGILTFRLYIGTTPFIGGKDKHRKLKQLKQHPHSFWSCYSEYNEQIKGDFKDFFSKTMNMSLVRLQNISLDPFLTQDVASEQELNSFLIDKLE